MRKIACFGLMALLAGCSSPDEQQERFAVSFNGEETEILYHVWREQESWVHLYASSESASLVAALQAAMAPFAREGD